VAPAVEYTFVGYWWAIIIKIPGLLFYSWRAVVTIPLCILFFVALYNRRIAEYWFEKWKGISPWWSVAVISILLLWGIMWAIFERERELYLAYKTAEERAIKAEQTIKDARAVPHEPRLTFTQRDILPAYSEYPFGIEVIIQTDKAIQPLALMLTCDGEIGKDANITFFRGMTFATNVGHGIVNGHPNLWLIHYDAPAFLPKDQIVVSLYSKTRINAIKVEQIPWSRNFELFR